MPMQVRFVGSGDAFGSGGRFNTCFEVTGAGQPFLIDCGASSMVALARAGVDANTIAAIFISHLHGDHFGGLPFFLLHARHVARRTAPLTIAGPPGLEARLAQTMEALFPGSSKVDPGFDLDVIELEPGTSHRVGDLQVTAFKVVHPSGAPPSALRFEHGGKVLTYSGDTEWTDALIEAARGADLFICECYMFDTPVKFHLDYMTLKSRLPEIDARRVVLTHMSAAMLARLDRLDIETAQDGLVVEV